MWNLGWCLLGVLAVALHQPGTPLIPLKSALGYVRAQVDFNLIVQYRSQRAETITYMEDYLDTFHKMKAIFLQFRVTKSIQAKIDKQRSELQHDRYKTTEGIAPSKHRRIQNSEMEEEAE